MKIQLLLRSLCHFGHILANTFFWSFNGDGPLCHSDQFNFPCAGELFKQMRKSLMERIKEELKENTEQLREETERAKKNLDFLLRLSFRRGFATATALILGGYFLSRLF